MNQRRPPTKQQRQRAAAAARAAASAPAPTTRTWDRTQVLAGLAALVAFAGVWLAPERPDPTTTDPGLPTLSTVPATPASGTFQSFCAGWNTWLPAHEAYLDGGDPQPAVDAGRELVRLSQRLTLTADDRAGFLFLMEPYAGPSDTTDIDLAVNNRRVQSFVGWLRSTCA